MTKDEVVESEEVAQIEQKDVDAEEVDSTPEDIGDVNVSPELSAKEKEADQMSQTQFPLVHNELVQVWMNYFMGRGRQTFEKYLVRSTRYIPLMKQILKEEGVPEDLIYLSMIESGFNPKAYSHAKAVGPWQFMQGTGVRYDLKVDFWIDERKDIVKSTHAAAQYLKELHAIFGSWYLAAAGYNAGEGKVLNAIRREKNRNFWELVHGKVNFRAETKNYVPKMIAAALLSKDPQKYGFSKDLPFEQPLAWDSVKIPGGIDLRAVAEVTGADIEVLTLLNAELRTGITPPDAKDGYEVRVPPEKKDILIAKMNDLARIKVASFINHKVGRGENLGYIARRYKTSVNILLQLNNIRNPRALRIGQTLKVPLPRGGSIRRSAVTPDSRARVRKTSLRTIKTKAERILASGKTVKRLKVAEKDAKKKPVKTATLSKGPSKKVSNKRSSQMRAKVAFKKKTKSPALVSHRVKRGDTLSAIAQRYNVSMTDLLKFNGIRDRAVRVGQLIKIPKD